MTALEIFLAFCSENMVVTVLAIVSVAGIVAVGTTLIVLNILNRKRKKKEH